MISPELEDKLGTSLRKEQDERGRPQTSVPTNTLPFYLEVARYEACLGIRHGFSLKAEQNGTPVRERREALFPQ